MNIPVLTRGTVATALVVGAALTVVSIATMPDFSGDTASWLTEIAASGAATLSAATWVVSQLFLAVGLLGVIHLLRSRVPVLASVAAVLVLVGAFGHAVYGGVQLTTLVMARDLGAVDTYASLLDRVHEGMALPAMAAGMLGTVVGSLTLGAALWRGGLGPRWVGPALVLWVVVEFAGSGFLPWSGYLSAGLYAVVLGALAVAVTRSSLGHWQTAAEAASPDRAAVSA